MPKRVDIQRVDNKLFREPTVEAIEHGWSTFRYAKKSTFCTYFVNVLHIFCIFFNKVTSLITKCFMDFVQFFELVHIEMNWKWKIIKLNFLAFMFFVQGFKLIFIDMETCILKFLAKFFITPTFFPFKSFRSITILWGSLRI
jgi:hypothetical protein